MRPWCFAATIVPIERKAAWRREVMDRVAVVTESSSRVPRAAQVMVKRVNELSVLDTLFFLAKGGGYRGRPLVRAPCSGLSLPLMSKMTCVYLGGVVHENGRWGDCSRLWGSGPAQGRCA